ncbi:hypothetical protein GCM10011313_22770 [Mycetocola zhadangensis]|nr:hypothetical protein GCM10011313_22770 [Mycetocola zhadangensis]
MAKAELESAVPLAGELKEQVLNQQVSKAEVTAGALEHHAARAASLTGDPIWRIAEFAPWLGPNLTAFREIAEVTERVSEDAVGPLMQLAASVQLNALKPTDGAVDLQSLVAARPVAESASTAIADAQVKLADIDTDSTVSPLRAAAERLSVQLAQVAEPVEAIRVATALVPEFLGDSGPRSLLLLFQNPAELRTTGGISGALALLETNAGSIDLVQQASSTDFPGFDEPVAQLPDSTRALYGDITAKYIQNVNLTPDFPLSASLARDMWAKRYGTSVDGVISIDPIALSYILEATGPITLATGDILSAENAVSLLLRDAYVRYSKPAHQDIFFAAAASAVFERVAGGDLDASKLIDALAKSGSERRINLWSAVEAEQEELAATPLAGALPKKTETTQPFGVYLNDATAAKMDFYLDVQIADGQVTCRKDDRATFGISVTLTNNAPLDAPVTFPDYVTGAGVFGVTPGNIKTLVNVYGSPELQNLGVLRDGAVVPHLPATDAGYQVSQIAVELAPGESTTLLFGFLGDGQFDGAIETEQTPVINRHETTKLSLSCENPLW